MVVEDEKPILELNTRLLEGSGKFQVKGAFQSPLEALEEIPKHHLDAVLLDIEMPKLTGMELAQKLVKEGIDVPIIFSTAHAQYAVEAFRIQALDYILKPMSPNIVRQLDERLERYYGVHSRKLVHNQLKVQLFGEALVKKSDQIIKWPTRVTEELFYYFLLHEGKVCSKWRIIDDIWSNLDEKRALANLYNTIYRMRQLFVELDLPIIIERVNDGYILKTNGAIEIDPKPNEAALLLEDKGYLWAYGLVYK